MLSVFTTQTPTGLDSTGTGINVGLSWKSSQQGAAFGVSYYKRDSTHDGQQLVGTLYDSSGRVLAQKARTQTSADSVGWVFILFDTVPPVMAGQSYISAVFYPTSAEPVGTKSMPVTNGTLTGIDTLFTTATTVQVPATSGAHNYFVDTLFNPSVFTSDGHSLKVEIAFAGTRGGSTVSADPNDPTVTPTWVDVTNYVTDISTDRGKTYELDTAQAGSYQVTLIGNDGRFDPGNTSSPYWPNVLCYRAIRLTATNAAGTVFQIFNGYVQDWPHTWDQSGMWCTVAAACIDALALLGQPIMNPAYQSEVLLDNPVAYWPMQEDSSATNAGNLVANGPFLTQQTVPSTGIPNGSTATAQFGSSFNNMAGGSTEASSGGSGVTRGTGIALTVDTSVVPPIGYYFTSPLVMNPVTGLTVEFWAIGSATALGEYVTLYNGVSGLDTRIYTTGTGVAVDVVNASTGSWHNIGSAPFPASTHADPQSGGCHVVVAWDGSAWRIYMNGTETGGPYNDLHPGAAGGYGSVNVCGRYSLGAALLNGAMSQLAIYGTALSATRIAQHAQVGLAAAQGEDTAARFQRILDYIPWTGPSSVPMQGDSIEGRCDSIVGETALQSLLDVVQDEQSNMYVSGAGEITFEERKTRYLQATPVAIFGENAGELHYEDGSVVNYDPTLVYNQIQGQRTHGVLFQTQDIPSQKRYFVMAYPDTPLTLRVNDDGTVNEAINFLLARYKNPAQRVGQVVFDLAGNPSQADALLALEIGDRVRFNRRQGGRPAVTLDCYIEDVAHGISSSSGIVWTIAFQLSPVFPVAAVTDLRWSLKTAVSSGATSMTINPLPDASVNAAESSIPKGTKFSTVSGTTMLTVTGVTSTGPGYTSATITFTPAVSGAHAVGTVFTDGPSVSGVYDDLATLNKYPIGL